MKYVAIPLLAVAIAGLIATMMWFNVKTWDRRMGIDTIQRPSLQQAKEVKN